MDKVEADIKKLFAKTAYENQTYFKFMNEEIKANGRHIEETNDKLSKLDQLFDLLAKKEGLTVVQVLENEMHPPLESKIEAQTNMTILTQLNQYTPLQMF
jgi:xylose isomerase